VQVRCGQEGGTGRAGVSVQMSRGHGGGGGCVAGVSVQVCDSVLCCQEFSTFTLKHAYCYIAVSSWIVFCFAKKFGGL